MGVDDADGDELALMVDRVQRGDRRAGWRVAFSNFRRIGRGVSMVRDATSTLPTWTLTPADIPRVASQHGEVSEVELTVSAKQLTEKREVIIKLIDEIDDQSSADDEEAVRPISCWLALDNDTDAISVNVGLFNLAMLPASQCASVREALLRFGGSRKALPADADLLGSFAAVAYLRLWAPGLSESS